MTADGIRQKILDTLKELPESSSASLEVQTAEDSALLRWVQIIDESPDSLKDWCKALLEFKKWEKQNRALTLSHKIEYLSCCREGGLNAGSLVSLTDLLIDYLKEHGVED